MKQSLDAAGKLNRRSLVKWMATGVSICAVSVSKVWASGTRLKTPEQTEGPFYPTVFPEDVDANLLQVNGKARQSAGQAIRVTGRIFDVAGNIIPNAVVEIWQCDSFGTYHHSSDTGRMDDNFQGFGRTIAGPDGRYNFQTIKPAAYPGRTPHIHFKVKGPGYTTLTTQMYFPDERANNMRDGIYRSLSKDERVSVTALMETQHVGESTGGVCLFDLVMEET